MKRCAVKHCIRPQAPKSILCETHLRIASYRPDPPSPAPDLEEGKRLRDEGIGAAASGREDWYRDARDIALRIAAMKGVVSADDLWENGVETPVDASPNVWGAIFVTCPWFITDGMTVLSRKPAAHARKISLWALSTEGQRVAAFRRLL